MILFVFLLQFSALIETVSQDKLLKKMSQHEEENRSSIKLTEYSAEDIEKAHKVLYNEGLRMRVKVNGEQYVEKALDNARDPFAKPMQEVTTHHQPPSPL